jgi:hypothetical protein
VSGQTSAEGVSGRVSAEGVPERAFTEGVPEQTSAEGVPESADTEGLPGRPYTAAEVDAALEVLRAPERMRHAQEVVTHAAPTLQRVLVEALEEGGWFGSAHDAEVARAVAATDAEERTRAVAALVAEQTRLGMFVGVAVGFELAHELQSRKKRARQQ